MSMTTISRRASSKVPAITRFESAFDVIALQSRYTASTSVFAFCSCSHGFSLIDSLPNWSVSHFLLTDGVSILSLFGAL